MRLMMPCQLWPGTALTLHQKRRGAGRTRALPAAQAPAKDPRGRAAQRGRTRTSAGQADPAGRCQEHMYAGLTMMRNSSPVRGRQERRCRWRSGLFRRCMSHLARLPRGWPALWSTATAASRRQPALCSCSLARICNMALREGHSSSSSSSMRTCKAPVAGEAWPARLMDRSGQQPMARRGSLICRHQPGLPHAPLQPRHRCATPSIHLRSSTALYASCGNCLSAAASQHSLP